MRTPTTFSVPRFELAVNELVRAHEEMMCVKRLMDEGSTPLLEKRYDLALETRECAASKVQRLVARMEEEK